MPVKWFEAGAAEYDLPVIAQVPILFLVMGFLETKRFQGFRETGTVSGGGAWGREGGGGCGCCAALCARKRRHGGYASCSAWGGVKG